MVAALDQAVFDIKSAVEDIESAVIMGDDDAGHNVVLKPLAIQHRDDAVRVRREC